MFRALKDAPWKKVPRIPRGLRLYVTGDVHGRLDALQDVFDRIDADRSSRPLPRTVEVFLGDYVDRGPSSRGVLDLLLTRDRNDELLLLKGNHEVLFGEFFTNPSMLEHWRTFGGLQTLASYGLKPSFNPSPEEQAELSLQFNQAVPRSHRKLVDGMPCSFTCGDFFFAHAGVQPEVPLRFQKEKDLLWIREDFLLYERPFGKIVVHGHTPVSEPEVRSNRINLDTGAYATGKLACLAIDHEAIGFV